MTFSKYFIYFVTIYYCLSLHSIELLPINFHSSTMYSPPSTLITHLPCFSLLRFLSSDDRMRAHPPLSFDFSKILILRHQHTILLHSAIDQCSVLQNVSQTGLQGTVSSHGRNTKRKPVHIRSVSSFSFLLSRGFQGAVPSHRQETQRKPVQVKYVSFFSLLSCHYPVCSTSVP